LMSNSGLLMATRTTCSRLHLYLKILDGRVDFLPEQLHDFNSIIENHQHLIAARAAFHGTAALPTKLDYASLKSFRTGRPQPTAHQFFALNAFAFLLK
jgi:hypothetical protein